MRVLLPEDVRTAAKRRISWLFDEFDHVVVNHSGGKDSEVVWHLALEVAREKDRLPLTTFWLDSELEWQSTVDRMSVVMRHPEVDPVWMQVPTKMWMGASGMEWVVGWDSSAKDRWMYPQQRTAFTSKMFGEPRFMELFSLYARHRFPDQRVAKLVGIRAEESPARAFGVATREVYKGETWGAVEDSSRGHYLFQPIYDWSFNDVWKAIEEGGWSYNTLYDEMWRLRIPRNAMRVADLTSGDMSRQALRLAEIEPDTYIRLQKRIGPEALERMEMRGWFPERLPHMFSGWAEYRDYLLENLVQRDDHREKMRRKFASTERRFPPELHDKMIRMQVGAVLVGDWKGTKSADWEAAHAGERITA